MSSHSDILWFKEHFGSKIELAVSGTPLNLDLLTAIACQETGYIWQVLRKKDLGLEKLLELCVGDTIDATGGRHAFPQTKADLVLVANGQQMFEIARTALENLASYIDGYKSMAAKPDKFCHGFGIFQYDLQFFRQDPQFFLQKRYADFGACLGKCLEELRRALRTLEWQDKTALTDCEMASVAIAYNAGSFTPSKGLKQGHFNGSKYYGEEIADLLTLSKTV